jgi:hypothetical protein
MPDFVSTANPTDAITRLIEEGSIGLSQAARLVGTFREGKPTHPGTVGRWILKGIVLPDGRRLKLEGYRLNGRLCTTKAAIIRFIAAQQNPTPPSDSQPIPRSPAARTRAHANAAKQLDALGFK